MISRKPLSPIEIQSHEFHRKFRGFDAQEVQLFLQAVAESYQTLILENQRLTQQVQWRAIGYDCRRCHCCG